jgi:hypothetical protein
LIEPEFTSRPGDSVLDSDIERGAFSAGHFTGSDVFVGVAEVLEDGDTVVVAVQRDCWGDSRTADGAFAGCGVTEAAQRACADRLNHWKTTNAPITRSMTSIATSLRFIPPV